MIFPFAYPTPPLGGWGGENDELDWRQQSAHRHIGSSIAIPPPHPNFD